MIDTTYSEYKNANAIYSGKTAKYLPAKEYGRLLEEKMSEAEEKMESGGFEPSFTIGSKAYTEKEWDTLLENLDATLEDFVQQMRAEHKQRFEHQLEKEILLEETREEEFLKKLTMQDVQEKEELQDVFSNFMYTSNGILESDINTNTMKYTSYESANYKIVPESEIGGFCIYNVNGECMGTFSYSDIKIRTDTKTGTQLLISEHGTASYSALILNEELIYGLKQTMHMDSLETESLEGYTVYTHGATGICYLIKEGDEGRGGNLLISNQKEREAFDKLAQTYLNDYPNLVSGSEASKWNAALEILGLLERTSNGILTINRDGMSYNNDDDFKKNWSMLFKGEYYEELFEYLKILKIAGGDLSDISVWNEFLEEKEMEIERIWSDEELEQGYLNN